MSAAAPPADRALDLAVERSGDQIEIRLIGQSATAQTVRYELRLTGGSTSRHTGTTTLAAGRRAVLSTMRMTAAPGWCVTLDAEEAGGRRYRLSEGSCA